MTRGPTRGADTEPTPVTVEHFEPNQLWVRVCEQPILLLLDCRCALNGEGSSLGQAIHLAKPRQED